MKPIYRKSGNMANYLTAAQYACEINKPVKDVYLEISSGKIPEKFLRREWVVSKIRYFIHKNAVKGKI